MKANRNDPCPCGSGRKYKKCCDSNGNSATEPLAIPTDFTPILMTAIAHLNNKQLAQAEKICMDVLQVNPFYSDALYVLGVAKHAAGLTDTGIMLLTKAIAQNSTIPDYYFNLGAMLEAQKKYPEALASFERCITLNPLYAGALKGMGGIYITLGQEQKAIDSYNRMIAADPAFNTEEIQHRLAALLGQSTDTAPQGYVTTLFDFYAGEFEHHLQGSLQYHIPELTATLIKETIASTPPTTRQLLDLGCGTGLSGAAIIDAGIDCILTGVDLSPKMLEKAESKKIYASLHTSDIVSFMQQTDQLYDIILAEDVFIYVGKLDIAFKEITNRLQDDGIFAFSIEKSEDEAPFSLRKSARYAHRISYIEQLIIENNLVAVQCKDVLIRKEKDSPIEGILMLLKKKS
jgi:predicted TPR repeat methyltransferase